jgi:hypothetical protein
VPAFVLVPVPVPVPVLPAVPAAPVELAPGGWKVIRNGVW